MKREVKEGLLSFLGAIVMIAILAFTMPANKANPPAKKTSYCEVLKSRNMAAWFISSRCHEVAGGPRDPGSPGGNSTGRAEEGYGGTPER
jgi:hypothetical protein